MISFDEVSKEDAIRLQISGTVLTIALGSLYVAITSKIQFIQDIAAIFIVLAVTSGVYFLLISLAYLPYNKLMNLRKSLRDYANGLYIAGMVFFFWGLITYLISDSIGKDFKNFLINSQIFTIIWGLGAMLITFFIIRPKEGFLNAWKRNNRKNTKSTSKK